MVDWMRIYDHPENQEKPVLISKTGEEIRFAGYIRLRWSGWVGNKASPSSSVTSNNSGTEK